MTSYRLRSQRFELEFFGILEKNKRLTMSSPHVCLYHFMIKSSVDTNVEIWARSFSVGHAEILRRVPGVHAQQNTG